MSPEVSGAIESLAVLLSRADFVGIDADGLKALKDIGFTPF